MEESHEKVAFVEHLVKMASERWGREEVEKLKSAIERIADAIWTLEVFQLEPSDEPAGTTRGR